MVEQVLIIIKLNDIKYDIKSYNACPWDDNPLWQKVQTCCACTMHSKLKSCPYVQDEKICWSRNGRRRQPKKEDWPNYQGKCKGLHFFGLKLKVIKYWIGGQAASVPMNTGILGFGPVFISRSTITRPLMPLSLVAPYPSPLISSSVLRPDSLSAQKTPYLLIRVWQNDTLNYLIFEYLDEIHTA